MDVNLSEIYVDYELDLRSNERPSENQRKEPSRPISPISAHSSAVFLIRVAAALAAKVDSSFATRDLNYHSQLAFEARGCWGKLSGKALARQLKLKGEFELELGIRIRIRNDESNATAITCAWNYIRFANGLLNPHLRILIRALNNKNKNIK